MDDQELSVIFPLAGLDVTCEFGRQTPDTTPVGANVRSVEPTGSRIRGGSRPGLIRHINETVSGANAIQHLAVLVDPQAAALNAEVDESTAGGNLGNLVLDPSTNNLSLRNFGRLIRIGGSGRQPNRNDPRNTPISYVQGTNNRGVSAIGSPLSMSSSFSANVATGDFVLAFICTSSKVGGGVVPTVTNGASAPFTQVGSVLTQVSTGVGITETIELTIWKRVSGGTVADATINLTAPAQADSVTGFIIGMHFRGVNASAPVGTVNNIILNCTNTDPPLHNIVGNAIPIDTNPSFGIACYVYDFVESGTAPLSTTVGNSFNIPSGTNNLGRMLVVMRKSNVSVTPTIDPVNSGGSGDDPVRGYIVATTWLRD